MFLATTADQRYWKVDEEILFLGEWCKPYGMRSRLATMRHQTLPYHWDDRARLFSDFLTVQQMYERTLRRLGECLNGIHGVDHSVRYWRIVVGPWLSYFTETLYDRYLSIKAAKASGLVTNTWIADGRSRRIPRDIWDFVSVWLTDSYNHRLYSDLIVRLGLPHEVKEAGLEPSAGAGGPVEQQDRGLRRVKGSLKGFLRACLDKAPQRYRKLVIVTDYLGLVNRIRLHVAIRQVPFLTAPRITVAVGAEDQKRRAELVPNRILGEESDEFEALLWTFIREQMPLIYLEGYDQMQQRAQRAFPRRPAVVLTATQHVYDEAFKFWLADAVDKGARLVCAQHGGHYGSGLWSGAEEHELKIADRYFSWGWCRSDAPQIRPLPAPQLAQAARRLRPNSGGRILWVGDSAPRYAYRMFSVPTGPTFGKYIEEQVRFVKSVSPEARRLLIYRPHLEYGWCVADRLKEASPELEISDARQAMYEEAANCRLLIGTCNLTPYLEALAADFPTLAYWNPEYYETRPEVAPHFEELRKAGILFDSAEAAAKQLDRIFRDPLAWWRTPVVQEAKNRFCDSLARSGDDWATAWARELAASAF